MYRLQLKNLFELDPSSVHLVSAKLGTGVKKLLDAVVKVYKNISATPQMNGMVSNWFSYMYRSNRSIVCVFAVVCTYVVYTWPLK